MKNKITVTILTKNSQKYLEEVLSALQNFEEVLICDTGSNDQSLEIAQKFPNVTIYKKPFIGFGPTHNLASSLAKYDWILSIDSDEVVSKDLASEIDSLNLTRGSVYSFPRHNEYKGKWIRWCGWHPDRQIRLYNRLDTHFTNALVHEAIDIHNLQNIHLKGSLKHYSYTHVSDFLHKMQSYTTLFAEQNKGKKNSSITKAIGHGFFAFIKSYFIKKGFMGGQVGFEISFYNANTAFYKYLKLAEANKELEN